jgi:hypothetical protein
VEEARVIPDEAVEAAERELDRLADEVCGPVDMAGLTIDTFSPYRAAVIALRAALPHLESAWLHGKYGHWSWYWSWCVPVHPEDLPADYRGYPDGGRLIRATDEAAIRADEQAKVRERVEALGKGEHSNGFHWGIAAALAAIDQEDEA